LTELDLYRKILNNPLYQVGEKAKSPIPTHLRGKPDGSPSFSTFYGKLGKKIFWKDWGFNAPTFKRVTANKIGIPYTKYHKSDIVALMALCGGISIDEAYTNLKDTDITFTPLTAIEKVSIAKFPLEYDLMPISAPHVIYSERLFIPPTTLYKFGVSGLKAIYSGPSNIYTYSDHNLGFYWEVGSGKKGYIPFNGYYKNGKWVTDKFYHQNIDELEGYAQLPATGQKLVFTKAMKEIWLFDSLGIPSVACSSETTLKLLTPELCAELVRRFKTIIVWGDPDPAGEAYSLEVIRRLKAAGGKDIRKANSIIAKDPTDIVIETQDVGIVLGILRDAILQA